MPSGFGGFGGQVNVPRPSGAERYKAPEARYGRSQFDLTHSHKTTYSAGDLVPYFLVEVLPGDTMTCSMVAFQRIFSPLESPIMDDIESSIDFFFVPNRILWANWVKFLGEADEAGEETTDYTIPILADGVTVGLGYPVHYMGLPLGMQTTPTEVSALPQRAYALIYNDWYRDQQLIAKSTLFVTADGPDGVATSLFRSAKKHDYFTSALPYLQKGDASELIISGETVAGAARAPSFQNAASSPSVTGATLRASSSAETPDVAVDSPTGSWTGNEQLFWDNPNLTVSINALREAAAVQRLLERDARGGTRYPEKIRAHFGVDVPDFRTQRPEYLGGGRGFINVSPVANTSATATEDQGELRGVGTGTLRASWAKSFVEHGYVMGILRARAQLTYQQGVERHWSRSTRLEFLWPELVNLGEQPIYKRELFVENDATDDEVFGYQERYADYRFKKSLCTGLFSSDAAGSLDFWHLAEDFAAAPALNQTFIQDASPMSRVRVVDTGPDFIIDGRFDLRVARILPVRPTPSLMDARF